MTTTRKTIKTITVRASDLQVGDVVQVRPAEKNPNKPARWAVVKQVRSGEGHLRKGTVGVTWANPEIGNATYDQYELVTVQQEVGGETGEVPAPTFG